MLWFWLVLCAMVLAAVAIVIIPLWSRRVHADTSRNQLNTDLFRERLRELDEDLQEARIDQTQHRQLRTELERTLLGDVPDDRDNRIGDHSIRSASQSGSTRIMATVIALAVPVCALLYYYFSSYRGDTEDWIIVKVRFADIVSQAISQPDDLPEEVYQDLPNFTRVLQARVLREGMRDANSLFLLGMSLLQMRLAEQAHEFLRRAYHLQPERQDIMTAYAQALMTLNNNNLTAESGRLLHAVLQRNPGHQGALMLLGLGAFNNGDYEIAIKAWEPLLASLDASSQGAALIDQRLNEARQLLNSAADKSAQANATAPAAQASITVTVDLTSELRARLQPEDTLFIFAKAASGPPMPLAAVRQAIKDFPIQVVLDDSKAMMPSRKLSDFQQTQVIVGARISKSGGAIARAGDFESLSEPLTLTDSPLSVSLMVDRVLQ